jgi:nitroreductase
VLGPVPVRVVHLADRARRKGVLDDLAVEELYAAPEVLLVFATDLFAAGGAVQRLLVALAAEGLGTHWVPASGLPDLVGAVAVGHPVSPPQPGEVAEERLETW